MGKSLETGLSMSLTGKTCPHCGAHLDIDQFPDPKRSGIEGWCRKCRLGIWRCEEQQALADCRNLANNVKFTWWCDRIAHLSSEVRHR